MEAWDRTRGVTGGRFESADAYYNRQAVVLELWSISESSGELVKDINVQVPPSPSEE